MSHAPAVWNMHAAMGAGQGHTVVVEDHPVAVELVGILVDPHQVICLLSGFHHPAVTAAESQPPGASRLDTQPRLAQQLRAQHAGGAPRECRLATWSQEGMDASSNRLELQLQSCIMSGSAAVQISCLSLP